MTHYGQFCPVAKGAEIFAERWTPLIIRELSLGSHRFNQLEHGLPRIPRSLLVQRLRSLERAGVVERRTGASGRGFEYHLTRAGAELADLVVTLGEWGQRWASADLRPYDIDLDLLMWDLHRRLNEDRLPDRRVVVQFNFSGAQARSYWLVMENKQASICLGDPGFDVDLDVSADTIAFHRIWMGHLSMNEAMAKGLVLVDGPVELAHAFPNWLAYGTFSQVRPVIEPVGYGMAA